MRHWRAGSSSHGMGHGRASEAAAFVRKLANILTLALATALGLALMLGPSSEAATAKAPVLAIDPPLPASAGGGEPEERASVTVGPKQTPPAKPEAADAAEDPSIPGPQDPPAHPSPSAEPGAASADHRPVKRRGGAATSTTVAEEAVEPPEPDASRVTGEPAPDRPSGKPRAKHAADGAPGLDRGETATRRATPDAAEPTPRFVPEAAAMATGVDVGGPGQRLVEPAAPPEGAGELRPDPDEGYEDGYEDPPPVAATTVAGSFVSDDGDGKQMVGAAVSSMMGDSKAMTEALEGAAAFSSGFLGLGGGASSDPHTGSADAESAPSGPPGGLLGGFLGGLP